ncbi:DHA2 family efflux MFS transporter permease subunit [Rhizobium sp. B230/85]|uniref:DHA2 family efflux MFS transporter permease subunit n=1 Tax=unclassified Rhizobium TaxID=2613769 RepID=UPI001ADA1107|nr:MULTISPECIES: DHA2 family efflux MFS transporter permease subunit [unclassified Rhizobium]MBO9136184.1 DHA2 family efflux MFS transporter permease subunit [Rhizobium sp. B209b/85]QXZ98743.1 DHA2 family efflux MFS transporter permease subunit [Rhizobium sp. B230/85]
METRKFVPLIVACAIIMQQVDSTAITTALPSMAKALNVSALSLHSTITVYLLALGIFLPISGWLADRFGARQLFIAAIGIFTLASLLCAATSSLTTLVIARLIQGFGGALMLPTARLIIVRSVPRTELVSAMLLMSMPAVIGPTIGPLIGGFIVSISSWRWIFWINLPFGILGILLTWLFIETIPLGDRKPFDFIGFVLSGCGIGAVILGFDLFSDGRGFASLLLAAVGMLLLVAYMLYARNRRDPILDLTLFRYPTFRSSLLGGSLFRMGFGAIPFMLPLMMQEVFGYSPLQSGVVTFVSAIGAFGMRTITKRILHRFGFRRVLCWNAIIASASIGLCALFTPMTAPALMMLVILLGGVFRALQFSSINTLAFADVESSEMSHATTLSQMAQRLAQSMGVAGAAAMLSIFSDQSGGLTGSAFSKSFVIVAVFSALSFFSFSMIPRRAGDLLAGRAS